MYSRDRAFTMNPEARTTMSYNFLETNPDLKVTLDLQNVTPEQIFAIEAAKLHYKACGQLPTEEPLNIMAIGAAPTIGTAPCSDPSNEQASDSSNPSSEPAAHMASHPSSASLKQPLGSEDLVGLQGNSSSKSLSKSLMDMTEEERVKRRREINRISQRRIRERRNKEVDALRGQVGQLQAENQLVLSRLEGISKEKSDLLLQVQELTDKWRQCISENAQINKENIELRNSLQHLNSLMGIPTSVGFAALAPQNGAPYCPGS